MLLVTLSTLTSGDSRTSATFSVSFGFNSIRGLSGPVTATLTLFALAAEREDGLLREQYLSGAGKRKPSCVIAVACLLIASAGVTACVGFVAVAAWIAPGTTPLSATLEGAWQQAVYIVGWWLIAIAYSTVFRKRVSAVGVILAIALITVLVGRLNQYPIFATMLTIMPQGALNILLIDSPLPEYAPHGFSGGAAVGVLLVWAIAPRVVVFTQRRLHRAAVLSSGLFRIIRVRGAAFTLVGVSLAAGFFAPSFLAESLPWTLKPSWLVAEASDRTPAATANQFFELLAKGQTSAASRLVTGGRAPQELLPAECRELTRGAGVVAEDDTTRSGPGFVRLTLQQRHADAIVSREVAEARLGHGDGSWRLVSVTPYGEC